MSDDAKGAAARIAALPLDERVRALRVLLYSESMAPDRDALMSARPDEAAVRMSLIEAAWVLRNDRATDEPLRRHALDQSAFTHFKALIEARSKFAAVEAFRALPSKIQRAFVALDANTRIFLWHAKAITDIEGDDDYSDVDSAFISEMDADDPVASFKRARGAQHVLRAQVRAHKRRAAGLEDELYEVRKEATALDEALDEAKERIANLEAELETAQQEAESARQEIAATDDRIDTATELTDATRRRLKGCDVVSQVTSP